MSEPDTSVITTNNATSPLTSRYNNIDPKLDSDDSQTDAISSKKDRMMQRILSFIKALAVLVFVLVVIAVVVMECNKVWKKKNEDLEKEKYVPEEEEIKGAISRAV